MAEQQSREQLPWANKTSCAVIANSANSCKTFAKPADILRRSLWNLENEDFISKTLDEICILLCSSGGPEGYHLKV